MQSASFTTVINARSFQLAEEKFTGDLVGIIGDFGEIHNHVKINKKIVKSSLKYSLEAWVVRKQKQKQKEIKKEVNKEVKRTWNFSVCEMKHIWVQKAAKRSILSESVFTFIVLNLPARDSYIPNSAFHKEHFVVKK